MLKVILPLAVLVSLVIISGFIPQAMSAVGSHPFILKWGESGTKSGNFYFPQSIAVDDQGNVYVTDLGNKRVQKFDNEGNFLSFWGKSGDGDGEFDEPVGIAVYENFVFVSDTRLDRIQKFDTDGNFITKWGELGDKQGQFIKPNGIAVDNNGIVYVADTENHRIQKFDLDGNYLSELYPGGNKFSKDFPTDIAIDKDGSIIVSDPRNNKISKFDANGNFVKTFNKNVGGFPIASYGLATDPNGNVYVADGGRDRIIYFDSEGSTITTFGSTGISNSQFKVPLDVAMDSAGHLFVIDSNGHRIQKFESPASTTIKEEQKQEVVEEEQAEEVEEQTVNPFPNDFTKPTIIPPNDMFVEATSGLTPLSIGKATATDENGIKSLTSNAPEQFALGTTTVIWTAIDGAGNVAVATQTITVVDTTPPVISPLSDIVVEAESSKNVVELKMPEVKDSVGVISVTNDAPENFPIGETTVTWTATDVAQNKATATQKITIIDTKPPQLYVPEDIVVEATSFNDTVVELGEPVVTDNGKIVSVTNDAPVSFGIGNTTVTWTAADSAGNVATGTQKVSVVDTTKPEVIPLENIVIEATSIEQNNVNLTAPVVNDVQPVVISNDAPKVFPLGDTIVTWTATDQSGNSASVTQTITVLDTTAPQITPPQDVTVEAKGLDNNSVTLGELTVEDVTGLAAISHDAPETFPFGTTIVTWSVTDNFGNTATVDQTVNVVDTTPPVIHAPKDLIIEATSIDENVVDLGEPKTNDIIGIESVTNDAPGTFPLGVTTVTWTAADTSGNTSTDTQIITVQDTTSPTLSIPSDITIEATSANGMQIDIGKATATDLIGVDSITNNTPDVFLLGTTVVTWSAVDTHGNKAIANQTITVTDTTAPSISPPDDIVYEAENPTSNVIAIGVATADDIVGVASIENDAPESFPLGDTLVTWTATDAAGNTATATQKVSVVDTTAPSITAPEDIQAEATSELETQVSLGNATASDIIGIKSIENNAPESFPLGDTLVTWTATDAAGNTATATQTVTIVDTTPPTIMVPEVITVEATSKEQNTVDFGNITTDDLVGVASVSSDAPDEFSFGLTTITWTATDAAGNTATATQKVSVVDTTAPSITAPEDIVIEATSADNNTVELGSADATDQVEIASITNDAPQTFPVGETIITWTATDTSGNSSTDTQKVTLVDTTAPTIIASDDIIVEASSFDSNTVPLEFPLVDDNVSDVTITNDAPEVFPYGETVITWTATDAAGNTATATQKVSVVDTTAPDLVVPQDVVIDAVALETQVSIGEAIAVDVTDSSPSITNDAPFAFPLGDTVITWTATDKLGNTITKTQKVTVQACGMPNSYYNMIMGTEDEDVIVGTNLPDLIFALGGDDIISGGKGNDCILAGDGEDIIYGDEGNDTIYGAEGNDIIKGQSGNDKIEGGLGLDIIDGGYDTDSCNVNDKSGEDLIVNCEF